jgi:hypothetical protein
MFPRNVVFFPNCKTLQRREKTVIFIGTSVRTSNRTWFHVWQFTDVSQERIASIFSVEERTKQVTRIVKAFTACFLLVAWLVYSSTVKTEAVRSSETSVNFNWTARRHVSEDNNLHSHAAGKQNASLSILSLENFFVTLKWIREDG